jgi:hypothetical protein
MIDYDIYLFSNLVKFYDQDFEALPYDEQFDLLPSMYAKFEQSEHNTEVFGLYECLILYFNDKNNGFLKTNTQ